MKLKIRKMVITAMLAALAYVAMVFIKIPLVPGAPFLKYEPKDVLLVITGFLVGPVQGFVSVILVCLLEMVTVSDTGPIGLLMNVISSLFFVFPAALIYHKKKTMPGAIIGLLTGVISMTGVMMLWNYLITPIYMIVPREVVVAMLPTTFLPFNLIKATINMAITLIIYKPISKLFSVTGLLRKEKTEADASKKSAGFSPLAIILGVLLLATCGFAIFLMMQSV